MRGELREYVMPDGTTRQYWDRDVPPEAKLVEKPKKEEAPTPSKRRRKAAK